jgi:hypothetical protein
VNGTTGTFAAGPQAALASGMPVARPVPLAPAGRRQWPGAHPWPLFSALGPVGALPTAPGLAREYAVMVLGGWGLARVHDLGEVSALVVSELATNVVQFATAADGSPRYQAGGRLTELWLRLMSDRALLQVEIWDNLPAFAGLPTLRRPAAEQEHGRGLAIVNDLSHRWGCDQVPGLPAKSVWALLKAR